MKDIEPKLKTISDYLKLGKKENFIIPEYQRAYSWDITQCDKLWQNIEEFSDPDNSERDPYFFGTIIIDCSEKEKYSLIDGQQRTTTFLLILKALLIKLIDAISKIPPNDEASEGLKVALNRKMGTIMTLLYKAEDVKIPEMLKDNLKIKDILIIENKSINELHLHELKKIIEATNYEDAKQKTKKIPKKQKENKYTRYFRNFKYFYEKLETKSSSELNKFAEIFLEKCKVIEIRSWDTEQAIIMFNSLNSSGLPLTDADIISAQLYSKVSEGAERDNFNKKWKEIQEVLSNRLEKQKIEIDKILQQFMYIDRALSKENDVTTPGKRKYFTDIRKVLLDKPMKLCDDLAKITNIWVKVIEDIPIVKLLLKYNENVLLYLASYFYRFDEDKIKEASDAIIEEQIKEVCECFLRLFTILELVETGYSSSKFKTFLFNENINLVDKEFSSDKIKKNFNEHIKDNWNEEDIKEIILEYDKNVLVFLNEYLYCKEKNTKFDFDESVNIEHIMPSSGHNIISIREDAGFKDENEFKSNVNKIGNKILLEKIINNNLGNAWFKTKKQKSIKNKQGYKDSKYKISEALTNYKKDTWGKKDIEKATEKAANRIVKFIFDK